MPGDDDVLVKVHAAFVNSWDWDNLRGWPIIARFERCPAMRLAG
ncbi:MAG: hypothetical protein ACE5MM_07290 [Nitrospiraceae bacterium]